MSLLDRLLEAQDAAVRPSNAPSGATEPRRASAWAGPSVLNAAQRRAMERALERELPGYAERMAAARLEAPEAPAADIAALDLPMDSVEAAIVPFTPSAAEPAVSESVPDPLPIWSPPQDLLPADEPLPMWPPPSFEPRVGLEPCPDCGEELAVFRIDLTANASWLECRACGRRWGGSIEHGEPELRRPLSALPSGERGHIAAG
jgi:hypothetical protein